MIDVGLNGEYGKRFGAWLSQNRDSWVLSKTATAGAQQNRDSWAFKLF